jgi:hypothetical protein
MEVAAVVQGEVITSFELHRYCLLTRTEEYFQLPQSERRTQIRAEELDRLILEKVLEHKAAEEEIVLTEADEERILFEIEAIGDRYRGVEGLREALSELGVPWEFFLDLRRRNLLIQKLTLRSISREIFVGPDQVRRYYEDHRGQFETEGEVRFRMLTVLTCARATTRSRPWWPSAWRPATGTRPPSPRTCAAACWTEARTSPSSRPGPTWAGCGSRSRPSTTTTT